MNKYYKFDPKLKKQNLSKWLSTHSRHRTNCIVAYILYALALVICIGCLGFVLLLSKDVDQSKVLTSAALGLSVGFIFGMIPFAIGQTVHTKSKKEYGRPYCRMTHEFLYVDDKGIQFGYHSTENKYTASMDVYQILYEDITRMIYDETHNIVTIIGCGELIVYDDYPTKRINIALSARKFYSDSSFSFILAFEDRADFLNLINSKKDRCL